MLKPDKKSFRAAFNCYVACMNILDGVKPEQLPAAWRRVCDLLIAAAQAADSVFCIELLTTAFCELERIMKEKGELENEN